MTVAASSSRAPRPTSSPPARPLPANTSQPTWARVDDRAVGDGAVPDDHAGLLAVRERGPGHCRTEPVVSVRLTTTTSAAIRATNATTVTRIAAVGTSPSVAATPAAG